MWWVKPPKIKNNTYGIDTGACHAGMLTAIELPGFIVHQIKVEKDHWKEEQSKWQIPVLEAKDWEQMKFAQVHKQIEKLAYKEEVEVQDFLQNLTRWIAEVEKLFEAIKTKLEGLALELKAQYGEHFNREVAKLGFRTFIFKANAGNLALEDLRKNLDTPQKVLDLAKELGLEALPVR